MDHTQYRLEVRLGVNMILGHLYDVYVRIEGYEHIIEVDAMNRNQAAKIAEKAGYVVESVNMVG